jgi:WD40 repeat protein/serine/threonine protein kinase/tetratricopeptide (TPR) repeat protein
MATPPSGSDLFNELAHEFAERYRRGERPPLEEYTDRYPDLADEIRELFPTLVMMERLGSGVAGSGPRATGSIAAAAPVPERLGDFRIVREIGRGGMGIVYEAVQESLGRHVALKVLLVGHRIGPVQLKRFEREAKAAALLHHTNIVPVFGVGQHEGVHFYAMQYIQGQSLDVVLREVIDRRGQRGAESTCDEAESMAASLAGELAMGLRPVSSVRPAESQSNVMTQADGAVPASTLVRTADGGALTDGASSSSSILGRKAAPYYRGVARACAQAAEALDYAHSHGVLHRDIKPANLLLDLQGTVWVADFGLAKADGSDELTSPGDVVGTLRYMAPERFRNIADARSDIYSLGMTLYEMLTLKPAFATSERAVLVYAILHQEPARPRKHDPRIPRDLETIVLKAIAKDPSQRFSSAGEMARELGRFGAGRPIHSRAVSPPERVWRWCRRNPMLAGAVGSAVTALIAVAALAVLHAVDQSRAATRITDLAAGLKMEGRRASDEAQRAKAALTESNRRLAMLNFERGQFACEQGDVGRGLLLMVESLRAATETSDPALRHAVLASVAAWRRHYPELKAVFSHEGAVTRAAFSPDGNTILTGSSDQTARLWDASTGEPVGQPLKHQGPVLALTFSPDGKMVLTGGDDQAARLWNAATGAPIGRPFHHQGAVRAVAFGPDGRTILTGSDDQTARLWDAATGLPVGQPLQHRGKVQVVAFSPDGKTVLTGSQDYTALLWDAASGQPIGQPLEHQHMVYAAAFSPDGKTVLTGSQDFTARLWDAATGRPIGQPFVHEEMLYAAVFSPDGKTVLTGALNNTARLWDVANGQPIGSPLPHQGPVLVVAFSPDGKNILTASWDGVARLWDSATGQPTGRPLHHQDSITSVAFSPDGKSILTASEDGTARLWDAAIGQPLGRPLDYQAGVSAAAFAPDGKAVLTASKDTTARIWNVATGQRIGAPLEHESYVVAAAFGPDGKCVLTGSWDTTARLWDAATGQPIGPALVHQDSVYGVAFGPDGKIILTGSDDHTARLWDAATGQPIGQPLRHQGPVRTVAMAPDGKTAVTGSWDSTARLWEVATGLPIGQLLEHGGPVNAVAFSPGGKTVLTASQDMAARLWDAATGQPIGGPLRHRGPVRAIAFSPDGKTILTASQDRMARLWEAGTGQLIGQPLPHRGAVVAVAFSPDGKTILTGSEDQKARLWDVATGQLVGPLLCHRGNVDAVAFGPDGKTMLTASWDETARLWNTAELPDDLPRLKVWIETLTGLELNEQSGIRVLDAKALRLRRLRLRGMGGPPDTAEVPLLDPIIFGPDPTARAQSLVKQGRVRDAEAAFTEAASARSSLSEVWIHRGECYITRSQLESAAADFANALDLEPGDRTWPSSRVRWILKLVPRDQLYARLLELRPHDGRLWTGRGRYYALRDRWDQAARDVARGIESAPPDSEEWFEHACLRLLVGDREGYRRLVRSMQRRSAAPKDHVVTSILVRSCNLASEPVVEPDQVVGWAEQVVGGGSKRWAPQLLGTALYRAGRFEEAIKRLGELSTSTSGKQETPSARAQSRLVLAMAHQRMGNAAEARALLDEVLRWWNTVEAAKIDGAVSLPVPEWLWLQVLRREAEVLILFAPAFPTDPFQR